ncbi:MAG TPA: septum formation initiator family protein [Streptosporangiaceae bacterium]|nr:septum formation initiator family protein [Streptosporangiaceae bacterium]
MAGPGGAGPAARRPERTLFTSRTAVLAVVVCAIALSLAYPVREYIAQRRQIDQLLAQRQTILLQLRHLQTEQRRLADPAYVEQLARDRLYLCMRGDTCYVVIGSGSGHGAPVATAKLQPWYERLWQSVHAADHGGAQ